jgi:predicted DCC family thiol-disulfide oxidoreductase YuxK
MPDNIIFFDGYCNFCSSSVLFILKRDKKSNFQFAPIQSDFGKETSTEGQHLSTSESIILFENNKYYYFSTAVLRISRKLIFPWNLFYFLIIIPQFLRDPVYKWFASKRYKWFGKRDSCFIPDEKEASHFL